MAVNLPKLPDVDRISTNIVRILGGNPSKFALQGTNTYLLGPKTSRTRLLVDTAQGLPAWSKSLHSYLDSEPGATISTCLLTHWHHDHIGGVADLRSIVPDVKVYKNSPTLNPDGILDVDTIDDIKDGERFTISNDGDGNGNGNGDDNEAFEIQALHCPGHAKDHMAFIITRSSDPDEVGSIFTADNVLGHGTAVFEDLATYLSSLALMKKRVVSEASPSAVAGTEDKKQKRKIKAYPGHGAVIEDAEAKIEEYIQHRKLREEEALNVLRYGTPKQPSEGAFGGGGEVTAGKEWESMEMVKVIYSQYPENLWAPAEGGLLMVLEKLRGEGRVVRTPEGRWKVLVEKAAL